MRKGRRTLSLPLGTIETPHTGCSFRKISHNRLSVRLYDPDFKDGRTELWEINFPQSRRRRKWWSHDSKHGAFGFATRKVLCGLSSVNFRVVQLFWGRRKGFGVWGVQERPARASRTLSARPVPRSVTVGAPSCLGHSARHRRRGMLRGSQSRGCSTSLGK